MAGFAGPEISNSGLVYSLDAANPKNFGLSEVRVLIVAGGGSGGVDNGGGGGGGGVIYNPSYTVSPGTPLTVTIGAGGAARLGTSDDGPGNNGGNSVFGALTAIGGSGGSGWTNPTLPPGSSTYSGGSGAGQSASTSAGNSLGAGAGTAGQGHNGGTAVGAYGGGGGGAGGAGGNATSGNAGAGGKGIYSDISGTPTRYAAGGAGGWDVINGYSSTLPYTENGTVKKTTQTAEDACPANTGHGGNGGNHNNNTSGAGGSGIVIVRYNGPQRAVGGTVTRVGNDTVHTFTSIGSTTFTPTATGSLSGLADHTNINSFAAATNSPTYNSSNNGSIVFNGSSNYLSTGALSGSFTSFTVFIWFYPTSVANYQNPIDCNYSYNGTTGNIGPRLEMNSSGKLNWLYSNNTGDNNQYYVQDVVASGLAANTWHCAAITFNGTTSTTYYNGAATALSRTSQGSPTGFVGVMNNVNIGRGFHLGGAERYFAGRVGTTLIYNRALSAAEISTLFDAYRDRYGI